MSNTAKKIDGIYRKLRTTLAKPENKRRMAWGTAVGIILGLIATLFINVTPSLKTAEAAIAASNLATAGNTTCNSGITTASISPSGNALVLAWVMSSYTASPATPTLTGNGLTWVQVNTTTYSTASPYYRITLFRAMGASPSSGSVTIAFGGVAQTGCAWSIAQFTGVDTSGTNGSGAVVQNNVYTSANTAVTSATVSLGAFANTLNATAAGFGLAINSAVTNEGGYSEFGDTGYNTPTARIQSERIFSNDTTPSCTFSSSKAAGIAVEIKIAPITIGGTSNGSGTVKYAINSTLKSETASISGGNWTLTVYPLTTGDIVTVWIDNVADASESTAVTDYDGSGNITGMVLNTNVLTIGSDGSGVALTVTLLDQYDCTQDEDIMHDAGTSSTLDVEGCANSYTSEQINILNADTLTIGGTEALTTHDIKIDGILTSGGNSSYNIEGSWDNNATFTASTSTVTMTATSGTESIDSTGASTSLFNNLVLGSSGTATWNLGSALDVSGALTIDYGTLAQNGTSNNITLAGTLTINSNGNYTKNASATLTFEGSSQVITDSTAAPGQDLGLVTIGPSTTTSVSTANKMNVTDLTIGADDTLDISSDTLSVGGNYVNSNTLTATSSTVDFTKSSATQTLNSGGVGAGKLFNNLTHSGAGTLQLVTNAINIDGIFTNSSGTFDANDLNMNVADDFLISGGSFSADVSPGATTQTVTFDGTNEATVSGSNTFRNLTMNTTTDGAKTIKFTITTIQTISNTWTLDGAVGKVLTLRSTTDTTAWGFAIPADINPAGDYIDVKDSQNNTNAYRITAGTNYVDSGNNVPGWLFPATNTAPNDPSSLAQKKTTDVSITVNTWTNETSVKFTATASDTDNPDTLYLCIEKDQTGTAFSNTEDSCGSGVAYSGTPVTVINTISSQTDATAYHWQARIKDAANAYSGWISFGGNTDPNDMDYGIDTTAPTGGTVTDSVNTGSLTQLEATLSGFDATVSELYKYEYAIGTTAGGTNIRGWTDNSPLTSTTITATGLSLQTSVTYYFTVRATDNATNVGTAKNSVGQMVKPTLSFTLGDTSINFENLNANNSYHPPTKNHSLGVTTNAANGYVIYGYTTQLLTSLQYSSKHIDNYGSDWDNPTTWTGYGFGYTSSDPSVQGSDRFGSGTKYCGFVQTPPGDIPEKNIVADNTGPTGGDNWTITYQVATSNVQEASTYQTTAIYIVVPNY